MIFEPPYLVSNSFPAIQSLGHLKAFCTPLTAGKSLLKITTCHLQHFNWTNELPSCLVTVQNDRSVVTFFAGYTTAKNTLRDLTSPCMRSHTGPGTDGLPECLELCWWGRLSPVPLQGACCSLCLMGLQSFLTGECLSPQWVTSHAHLSGIFCDTSCWGHSLYLCLCILSPMISVCHELIVYFASACG